MSEQDINTPNPEADQPDDVVDVSGDEERMGGADAQSVEILEDRIDTLEEEIGEVREMAEAAEGAEHETRPEVFFANTNSDGTWAEVIVGAGTDNTLSTGSIRLCNDSTHTSAMITLGAGQSCVVEVETPTETKYIQVGGNNSTVNVLTNETIVGSGSNSALGWTKQVLTVPGLGPTTSGSITMTAITVITAIQVSGNTLQYKTQTLLVVGAGAASDWTTFHTGTTCP